MTQKPVVATKCVLRILVAKLPQFSSQHYSTYIVTRISVALNCVKQYDTKKCVVGAILINTTSILPRIKKLLY